MPKLRLSLLSAAVAASLPLAVNAAPDLDSLTASQAAADICAGKYRCLEQSRRYECGQQRPNHNPDNHAGVCV